MQTRLLVATFAVLIASLPATASAKHGDFEHYRAHTVTATASCSGGTGFTVDGNAYFGQLTETNAWNAGDHGTTCGVELDD